MAAVLVEGDTRLIGGLVATERHLGNLDEAAGVAVGRLVLSASRPPVDTGALAADLAARATRGGITFTSGSRYAPFVHWGTSRVAARPWFVDAIDQHQASVIDQYRREINKQLSRVKGA